MCSLAKLCLTLCDPMDCPHQAQTLSTGFPRHKYWNGLPFLSPVYILMYIQIYACVFIFFAIISIVYYKILIIVSCVMQ